VKIKAKLTYVLLGKGQLLVKSGRKKFNRHGVMEVWAMGLVMILSRRKRKKKIEN